jgi:hypothetical protein
MKVSAFSILGALSMSMMGLIGCSASDPSVSGDSQDVVTSECPSTFDLSIGSFSMMSDTSIGESGPFDPNDPADKDLAVALNVRDAVQGLGTASFHGKIASRKAGHCTYSIGNDGSADLFTKRGKTILQVDRGVGVDSAGLRVYAFPSAISASALTFGPNATAILDDAADSVGSEGPNIVARIGTAKSVTGK